jgi:protein O-mannosyl-transferase
MPARAASEWPQRLAIVGAASLTFARALPYPLQQSWDDGRFIVQNPDLQRVSWAGFARMFSQVQFEAYHPLHLLSYWLDVPWLGPNPLAIHAVSLGLWVLAVLTVYELLRALEISAWAALVGTLLCGLHPVQVEVVSWASGRKDILALQLSAASLLCHVRARTAWDARAWASRALYALALLAKTTAVPLPLFALLLDVFVRRSGWRQALLRQLPSFALGAGVSAFVIWLWGEQSMLRAGPFALAGLRVSQTLGHQLLTALWPARTSPMYASQQLGEFSLWRSGAVLAYALACGVAYRRASGVVCAGLFGFAVLMLPVSNLFPLYFPFQDRYLSLPLLALAIALAGQLSGARGSRLWPGFALVSALALRTWQYEGAWCDELHLWGHAASTQPDADYAWIKLGEVRRDAGDLEGAIGAYRAAVHVAPTRKLAHAALFEAVALRDERYAGLRPSLARSLAHQYYERLDQLDALRQLADQLLGRGYARSAELPLQLALWMEPLPDSLLEHAAEVALRSKRVSLAAFYVRNMQQRPQREPLAALAAQYYFAVTP